MGYICLNCFNNYPRQLLQPVLGAFMARRIVTPGGTGLAGGGGGGTGAWTGELRKALLFIVILGL